MRSRREQLEELLALEPNDPFLCYGLAMEDASAGNDAEASRRLQELLANNPTYIPAYLQAGQILVRLGQDEEARKVLTAGISAARQARDDHAAGEMQGLLQSIE